MWCFLHVAETLARLGRNERWFRKYFFVASALCGELGPRFERLGCRFVKLSSVSIWHAQYFRCLVLIFRGRRRPQHKSAQNLGGETSRLKLSMSMFRGARDIWGEIQTCSPQQSSRHSVGGGSLSSWHGANFDSLAQPARHFVRAKPSGHLVFVGSPSLWRGAPFGIAPATSRDFMRLGHVSLRYGAHFE